MKNLAILLLALILLSSCEENISEISSGPGIVGTYQLTAQLFDPGDGSGTFEAVKSNNTLQFMENGSVTSNWNMCRATSSFASMTGTYTETEIQVDGPDCGSLRYKFELGEVIIILECTEPCMLKYTRI